jgi:alcohol dehydrogenase
MTSAQIEPAKTESPSAAMHALVYRGNTNLVNPSWELAKRPTIQHDTDAIVRVTTTTICGTDLHILKGDVPTVTEGRILGHEGVGLVEEVGSSVTRFQRGDRVLISCITSCGKCDFCLRKMYSHCRVGGWTLGNTIDGTQAEYVRIPYADTSLHALPADANEEAAVMLSDILPTGLECGVLNGCVKPGDTIAIVGTGPIGLAALMTSLSHSPAAIICIDLDDKRLEVATRFGATSVINSTDGNAAQRVMELTNGEGVNVAMEAVGIPATFDICQSILAPGGHLANIGVHGQPVTLRLEKLWDRNVTITTRLVDTVTTPALLKAMQSGDLFPGRLVTHRFAMADIMKAYETFANAATHGALKVALKAS